MDTDNWEQRFDAVVKETERNLAKVKGTLQYTPNKYNISEIKSDRKVLLELSPRVTYSATNMPHTPRSQGKHLYSSTPTNNGYTSTPTNNGYQKQLWKQEDELSQLRKQISLLEQSNIHYEQESKLLKSQVSSLKKKLTSSPTPPHLAAGTDFNRELEKFKREVLEEVRRMKQEIGISTAGQHGHVADKEWFALHKDMDNSRLRHAEDFQEVKNDLETMRNRMMKVELEVKSAMTDCKECNRKCQRIENEVSHISETMRLQGRSTSSQLQSLNDNCAHISIMRSSVSDLEGRLSSLECRGSRMSSLRNESATPGSMTTRGSSYIPEQGINKVTSSNAGKLKHSNLFNDLDISLDDLSLLSDEDEITLDISQMSDADDCSTFKRKAMSKTPETISVAESVSLAEDLISGISELLSDDEVVE